MTNQLKVKRDEARRQVDREILAALEFELVGAIAHAGGVLTGFSMKIGEADCLMTLRAEYGSKRMVSFVGCPDMSSCFRKAVSSAYTDALKWREDQFLSS